MRILHVVTKADVGGAQTYVLETATAQLAAGHEVRIVSGLLGAMAEEAARRGIEVREEASLRREVRLHLELGAVRRMSEQIAQYAPDVVHLHSSKAGVLGRMAARRVGVPTVFTAHGWLFQSGVGPLRRAVAWLGETAMGHWWGEVICLTEAEAELARRWHVVPRARLHVVPNALPDVAPEQRADLRTRAAEEPVRLVMVARFAAQKAQRDVLDALAQLPRSGWTMTFVGDGPEWELSITKARTLGLDDRVVFAGHRDDVPAVLAASDIGMLWSHYEGMPLALMEAMRAGLACVANDLPGVRALFGEPPVGVIVPFDASPLGAVLIALIEDESRRSALGRAGRERFAQKYSMSAHLAALDQVYAAARQPS